MRRSRLIGVALLVVGVTTLGIGGRPLLLAGLTSLIQLRFPAVRWIAPDALRRLQADSLRPPPILLDVRTAPEFATSHLAGARRLDPDAPLPSELLALPRSTPIVTYCAVSYRSAVAAQALADAGFTDVRDLEGSIFRWANEGRPLVAARGPVSVVHGYGSPWRWLLKPGRRAP